MTGPVHGSFLAGVEVLDCSQNVAGAYAAQLLSEFGAMVHRPAGIAGPENSFTFDRSTVRGALNVAFRAGHRHDATEACARRAPAGYDIGVVDSAGILGTSGTVIAPGDLTVGCRVILTLRTNQVGARDASSLTPGSLGGLNIAIGEPGRRPLGLPFNVDQYAVAANAVCAALAALLGDAPKPVEVGVDAADVLAWYVGMNSVMFAPYGRQWRRDGFRAADSSGCYPAASFRCADGYVGIYGRTVADWQAFKTLLGNPAWGEREDLADPERIAMHSADEVDALIAPLLARRSRDEVFQRARELGLPTAPVLSVPEALAHPQIQYRDHLAHLETPGTQFVIPRVPVASYGGPPGSARNVPRASANPELARPLSGIRVIELCWVWAGPMLGAILADLGAEVIKIEHISRMDSSRLRGRPADRSIPADIPDYETVPYFHQMNHGKKSVSINLKTPEGREEAFRLAAEADVLIENLRPGALDRAGLGYRDLSSVNPEIVYIGLSATGRGGPLEDIRAYAPVLSSLAGLERSIGYEDGTVTGMMTHAFSDPNAAIYGLMCCLAAIRHRRATGQGCLLDISQLDAVLSVMREAVVAASITGEQPPLRGDSHVSFAPFGHFRCAGDDEWVAICVTDDCQWAAAKAVIGDPRLDSPAFDTAPDRAAGQAIDAVITEWSAAMTPTAAAGKLLAAGVDAAPVLGAAAALERARTRGRVPVVTHARTGAEELWSLPWTFDGTVLAPASAAPLLGAHTGWSET